jgi:hypothetical protein
VVRLKEIIMQVPSIQGAGRAGRAGGAGGAGAAPAPGAAPGAGAGGVAPAPGAGAPGAGAGAGAGAAAPAAGATPPAAPPAAEQNANKKKPRYSFPSMGVVLKGVTFTVAAANTGMSGWRLSEGFDNSNSTTPIGIVKPSDVCRSGVPQIQAAAVLSGTNLGFCLSPLIKGYTYQGTEAWGSTDTKIKGFADSVSDDDDAQSKVIKDINIFNNEVQERVNALNSKLASGDSQSCTKGTSQEIKNYAETIRSTLANEEKKEGISYESVTTVLVDELLKGACFDLKDEPIAVDSIDIDVSGETEVMSPRNLELLQGAMGLAKSFVDIVDIMYPLRDCAEGYPRMLKNVAAPIAFGATFKAANIEGLNEEEQRNLILSLVISYLIEGIIGVGLSVSSAKNEIEKTQKPNCGYTQFSTHIKDILPLIKDEKKEEVFKQAILSKLTDLNEVEKAEYANFTDEFFRDLKEEFGSTDVVRGGVEIANSAAQLGLNISLKTFAWSGNVLGSTGVRLSESGILCTKKFRQIEENVLSTVINKHLEGNGDKLLKISGTLGEAVPQAKDIVGSSACGTRVIVSLKQGFTSFFSSSSNAPSTQTTPVPLKSTEDSVAAVTSLNSDV